MTYSDRIYIIYACPPILYLNIEQDELNEYVYAAELAGLGYSLANTKAGITLAIKVNIYVHIKVYIGLDFLLFYLNSYLKYIVQGSLFEY